MLGIRDVLVRIRIRGFAPLPNGSGSEPTPDPTSFFSDFKDGKKLFCLIFFPYNLPAGTLSSVLKFNILLKFCVKIFFCKYYKEGSGSASLHLTNGSGSGFGRPETCESCGSGSGSPTLLVDKNKILKPQLVHTHCT